MAAEFFSFDIELPEGSDEYVNVMIDPLTGSYNLNCDTTREGLVEDPAYRSWGSNMVTIGEWGW